MKPGWKVVGVWFVLMAAYATGLSLFPHQDADLGMRLNRLMQSLLFVLSVFLYRREPSRRNKAIFLNFSFWFSISLFSMVYDFVGVSVLTEYRYARFIMSEFINIAFSILGALAIVYVVIDSTLSDFRIYQKYIGTGIVVALFATVFFHSFFIDPLHAYSSEEIMQWKSISNALPENGEIPSAAELAGQVRLQSWKDGRPIADLYPEENLKRIESLLPYLEGDNVLILLFKPLYSGVIQINVFMIFLIIVYFGYQYVKDPPQGVYIDKIMFLLLLLCSMEIVHHWGYLYSVAWSSWIELFVIGQYVTLLIVGFVVMFFILRLRFITSVQGEFYETELESNPRGVTRWRDWIDNIVLAHVFNHRLFNGRLFDQASK